MMYKVLQGCLSVPAEAERRTRVLCAVGEESEVFRDQDLLAQLAVQRQLCVVTVPLQVKNQHPVEETRVRFKVLKPSNERTEA